jgi:MoaA/NifB/PqqE/SkfB family radical SAM enzyme
MARKVTIDCEATNRCNAKCYFCPRDATPHQGLMTMEVFEQTLERAVELSRPSDGRPGHDIKISLCGLGEPLLNPKTPEFVRRIREAGFECVMSSNASILDERRGRALLDAGLQQININVGDVDDEYEHVYKLPFEKTRDNIIRFAEMAGDECQVNIVLVDHHMDRAHIKKMVKYWRGYGLSDFVFFDVMNRGGSLFVDHMQYETYPEVEQARALLGASEMPTVCALPFVALFVGYDGKYYLCCSDWTKETPMGTVFDESFSSITRQKLTYVLSREPVCKSCNWDPVNRLTDVLRAIDAGEEDEAKRDALIADMAETSAFFLNAFEKREPGLIDGVLAEVGSQAVPSRRKSIPLTVA